MAEIKLTQDQVAIVDDENFERLNKHKWYAMRKRKTFYAAREVISGERKLQILMHREILNAPLGVHVDHVDGNGLNNKINNIRICTRSQNQYNRGITKRNKSGYKGVRWDEKAGKFRSVIHFNHTEVFLGHFTSVIDAARAYDEAAIKYHGEFAKLNIPERSENGFK
jgi:hypothetical protein